MNWTETIDAYCERTDPSFWAEPLNAATNAAFLIAAFIMWRRVRGQGLPIATALTAILGLIGVGSFLFHTFATGWAALADTLPILLFILLYLFAANRHYWNMGIWASFGVTALFFPYAFATGAVFAALPFFQISASYWPVPLLISIYAFLLRSRAPVLTRGLMTGVMVFLVSITLRSVDELLCDSLPIGTHFFWHILNALMLAVMIEAYRRHMVASAAARG